MNLSESRMISPAVGGLAQRIKLWRAAAIAALGAVALFPATVTQAQTSIFNTFYVGTLATGLGTPSGIAVDSAYNLYVAQSNLDQIGIFNASGIETGQFIGTGTGLINPWGVAASGAGSSAVLSISDSSGSTIYQVASGTSTVLAGQSAAGFANGTGTAAQFSTPLGVAVDAYGDVFVADQGNDVIREITPLGVVTTLAGQVGVAGTVDGTGTGAQFNRPTGIAIDANGVLFVTTVDSIRRIALGGVVTTLAGSPGAIGSSDGTGSGASFFYPEGIAVDESDNVYVADTGNRTIREVTSAGVVTTIAGQAGGSLNSNDGLGTTASFTNPVGVAVTPNGNLIYVTDQGYAAQGGGMIRVVYLPVAPQITASPQSVSVAAGSAFTLTVGAIGGPLPTYQWYLYGAAIAGATAPTYTVASAQGQNGGVYTVTATNTYGSASSASATVTVTGPPTITSSPQSAQLAASGGVTLSVTAAGVGPFSYQWLLNGSAISGANSSTYVATTGGVYTATVSNAYGSATSSAATVTAVAPPVIASQPQNTQITASGSATLSVAASGVGPLAYQWFLNGSAISGATSSSYTATAAGSYAATVSNSSGSVTSGSAIVLPAHRLVNLSTRGFVGTGANSLTAGFVSSGTGTKQYLIRAIGPTLSSFGVSGVLAQPVLTVYSGTNIIASNTIWGNSSTVATVELTVGAFALPANSADSALVATLSPGSYTAQVIGVGGTTGNALVEIYEVGSDLTTLANLSTRGQVAGTSQNLVAGLVVSGTSPIQVLLRGIGPALSSFGIASPLARPLLTLYSGTTVIATNSGWSAGTVPAGTISAAESAVGAFALPTGSADTALLMTLAPGTYTVQVSSGDGTAGIALVEAYQVQ